MTDLKDQLAERATGEVAERQPSVADLLERQKAQIARALPAHMNPERYNRIVLTECRRNPRLMACTPISLLGAVMTGAQLGLEPDARGLAYLIPRWSKKLRSLECTFMIGYKGYLDLARRSGTAVSAEVVYENDEFDFELGTSKFLRHKPLLVGDRGKRVAAWAAAAGEFMVLSIDEVEKRRGRSTSEGFSPWDTDYDAMCRKTAVRAFSAYLPQSIELATAERLDGAVRTDIDTNLLEYQPPDDVIDVEGEEEIVGETGADLSAATATGVGDPEAEPAPVPDEPEGMKVGIAKREVTSYRATKAAGATGKHRALDAWLNDREIGMDLENIDPAQAVELLEWIAKNPIGKRVGDA